MPTPKTHRPSVSDIALAMATRQPREKSAKVTISNANAKGHVHGTFEITDSDAEYAAKVARDLMHAHLAEFGDPRENGAQS